jgi:hypothetical protein
MHSGGEKELKEPKEPATKKSYKNNSILIVLSIPLYSLPPPLFMLASQIKICMKKASSSMYFSAYNQFSL